MELKTNKRFEDFPATKLYRDDIEKIFYHFTQVCDTPTLEMDGYEGVKFDELHSFFDMVDEKKLANLKIKSHTPFVEIELNGYGITAYSLH